MKYGFILLLFSGFLLSCEQEISSDQADSFIKFYGFTKSTYGCRKVAQFGQKNTYLFIRKDSGHFRIDVKEFDMKNPNLSFFVHYDMMDRFRDEMIIYCGRKDNPGKILFSTGKKLGKGRVPIRLKDCGNSAWITIKIISANNSKTQWAYEFVCP